MEHCAAFLLGKRSDEKKMVVLAMLLNMGH